MLFLSQNNILRMALLTIT